MDLLFPLGSSSRIGFMYVVGKCHDRLRRTKARVSKHHTGNLWHHVVPCAGHYKSVDVGAMANTTSMACFDHSIQPIYIDSPCSSRCLFDYEGVSNTSFLAHTDFVHNRILTGCTLVRMDIRNHKPQRRGRYHSHHQKWGVDSILGVCAGLASHKKERHG